MHVHACTYSSALEKLSLGSDLIKSKIFCKFDNVFKVCQEIVIEDTYGICYSDGLIPSGRRRAQCLYLVGFYGLKMIRKSAVSGSMVFKSIVRETN